jgi:hypothetical protein
MGIITKSKLTALGAAALAVAGGSAALAATGSGSPSEESKKIVDAAAADLGVSSTELTSALKKALLARVDAQLKAGSITEEQATTMKERIDSDSFALFGPLGSPRGGGHHGMGLATAATYLGTTETALRTSLQSGKSLADVAKATDGKSVDGLVAAIVAAEKKQLAAAVAAGRLTEAQQKEMLASLAERVTAMVNGERPEGGPGGPGGPDGHGGAIPSADAAGTAA